MELNSDDEYYNKYLEIKQQYIMLKQLKNNNELEGGGIFDGWFGPSEAEIKKKADIKRRKKEAEEARVQQAALEQAAAEEAAKYEGDGTYLVFQITDFENYSTVKYFNYDNSKKKPDVSHDGADIVIMKKSEFSTAFSNAYIVKKNKDTYTYKLISEDTEFQNIYEEIKNAVNEIHDYNYNCLIKSLDNNHNETINSLTLNINDAISVYNSTLSMKEKELFNTMKTNITNIMNTGKHQMFILHTLNHNDAKFNESTNVRFLEKLNEEINAIINANIDINTNGLKPYVDFNMILKIKDNYEESENYIFDKIITKQDASYTAAYAKIGTIISEYDYNTKNKTTEQIKAPGRLSRSQRNLYPVANPVPNPVNYTDPRYLQS